MNELDSHAEFCTVRQLEVLESVIKHGSNRAAAKAMGINKSTVCKTMIAIRAKAAQQHIPAHGSSVRVPDGFAIKGTSTLRKNEDGALQWVKTDRDEAHRTAMLQELVASLCEEIKGKSPRIEPPTFCNSELLACYPIGDHHYGMRSDADETGSNYDCKIATQTLESAFDYLIAIAPPAETALMINFGDFEHANDSTNETPGHGNKLDCDSRYGRRMHGGALALIHSVLKLLAKHKRVVVWNMPGNHDPEAYFALAMAMSFYFHDEPRVEVDMGTSLYKYLRFGKNLIASHHGHGAKSPDLPLIMAADRKEDWAQTDFRVWHCGHIHHKTQKDFPGCTVETHRTLAPPDSWHHGKGYRSMQDMNAIVYHAKYGEIQRSRFDTGMLV